MGEHSEEMNEIKISYVSLVLIYNLFFRLFKQPL